MPQHGGVIASIPFNLAASSHRRRNKVLRQRLRGPALAAWYPKKTVSFQNLQNTYKPLGLTTFDEAEDDRKEAIQIAKLRGEGPADGIMAYPADIFRAIAKVPSVPLLTDF
ncbi:Ribosomal protein S27/S33 mitochondrial [Penicillium cf. griseofulvum]|nr:Ribosomal protein S27/S33 mitochondrial [Penicillium cf. griseofulvum]